MQPTTFCIPSSSQNKRASSLPNKIKIRTCKLPKDFFQAHTAHLIKGDSGVESSGSTCDDETSQPRTPSFKENSDHNHHSKHFRKAETARLILADSPSHNFLVRQRSQSIRRKLSRQVSERFPILLLPPINTSGRVFVGM